MPEKMHGFVIVYTMELIFVYRAGAFVIPLSSWSRQHPNSPRTPTTNTTTLSRPIEFRDSRYFTRSNFGVASEYSEGRMEKISYLRRIVCLSNPSRSH
jgi:hypothetical protein